jgi:predicted nucleic acid-binding protein
MVVIDTSVWVDYFNGVDTPTAERLDALLDLEPLAVGDVILTEVLQGFRHDRDYRTAEALLTSLTIVEMLGEELAIRSADNFRRLRKVGITVRKTMDVIIATSCIEKRLSLLYSDRDFEPFCKHLGLRNALSDV